METKFGLGILFQILFQVLFQLLFQISLYSINNMIVQICYLQYELLCIFCQSHSQPENDLFLSTSRQVVGENFQFSPLL